MIDIKPLPPKGWVRFFAGPHGSGKSTLRAQMPDVNGILYVNPDEIQKETGKNITVTYSCAAYCAIKCFEKGDSFEYETVLASDIPPLFEKNHYKVSLVYCITKSVDRCIQNVRKRAKNGGHNVPESKIRECYTNSINTFCKLCDRVAESYLVFNDGKNYTLVAHSTNGDRVNVAPEFIIRCLPQELQTIMNSKYNTCKCR